MRSTPLRRRRLWRPPPREPRADAVTQATVDLLWRLDGGCVAAQVEKAHACKDRFGNWIRFNDRAPGLITVEHFWPDYAVKGKRGPLMVLLCAAANIGAPSKDLREKFRDWRAARPLP